MLKQQCKKRKKKGENQCFYTSHIQYLDKQTKYEF